MNIPIIYEDSDVVVLNKPAGVVVHGDGKSDLYTLVDWILEKYPSVSGVGESLILNNGEEIDRSGIVHRIDKETSGVIVVAKNNESYAALKDQFQSREIKKIYNAFVYGQLKEKIGSINTPIGKSTQDFRKFSSERGAKGSRRDARTEYKVLKENSDASYLEVRPKTGRTHQIRVHLKSISHPVVCDNLYAPKRACVLGFERLALHARSINLHLLSGLNIVLEADLPNDFVRALEKLN